MKLRAQQRSLKKSKSVFYYIFRLPYLAAVFSLFTTLFVTLALTTYDPYDPSWFYYSTQPNPVHNAAGLWGAQFAAWSFYLFGIAAYFLMVWSLYAVYYSLKQLSWQQEGERIVAASLVVPAFSTLFSWHGIGATAFFLPGGVVGKQLMTLITTVVGSTLAGVVLHSFLFILILVVARFSGIRFLLFFKHLLVLAFSKRDFWAVPVARLITKTVTFVVRSLWRGGAFLTKTVIAKVFSLVGTVEVEESLFGFPEDESDSDSFEKLLELSEPVQSIGVAPKKDFKVVVTNFALPSLQLFVASPKPTHAESTGDAKLVAATLEEKLSRFGVKGSVVAIKKGPVVTLFEYQPAIDTKLSKIIALEQDLAMALEAMSVRIIAPIPGTARVGFEVSNKERVSVRLGDCIRSLKYQQSTAHLPLILGTNTAGQEVVVDLVDMPHLLVAGSTGSGKSIALNAMLMSLLCRLTPQQLKLIIIDPKRLEFASYQDIPHLLFPIITDPHRAAPVIRWLVKVMEDRYQAMADQGVRSIAEYKKRCSQQGSEDELPYLVVIIDELADLMMVSKGDCEEGIARLAQMARAAGIHLIVATQRPSVDVITGLIKVNFPSRISFRLTSKIDSRTILDSSGAESLLGKGDMLFMDAQSASLRRVHGAYVSDSEIRAVVDYLKTQQKPDYVSLEEVLNQFQQDQASGFEEPLLPEVLVFLQSVHEVSISLLQRRFKIGYNRSARLIELLEMQGKVMPADGSKMRKVIR